MQAAAGKKRIGRLVLTFVFRHDPLVRGQAVYVSSVSTDLTQISPVVAVHQHRKKEPHITCHVDKILFPPTKLLRAQ